MSAGRNAEYDPSEAFRRAARARFLREAGKLYGRNWRFLRFAAAAAVLIGLVAWWASTPPAAETPPVPAAPLGALHAAIAP